MKISQLASSLAAYVTISLYGVVKSNLKRLSCLVLQQNMLWITPRLNFKVFTCLKMRREWLNKTTEVVGYIKHHHAEHIRLNKFHSLEGFHCWDLLLLVSGSNLCQSSPKLNTQSTQRPVPREHSTDRSDSIEMNWFRREISPFWMLLWPEASQLSCPFGRLVEPAGHKWEVFQI